MHEISVFLDLFRKCLENVDESYYDSHAFNEGELNEILEPSQIHDTEKKYLEKFIAFYGERVFCYELYHQVRTLMENHLKIEPILFKDVMLQSELKKQLIDDTIKIYRSNTTPLDAEYFPDFLLHSPSTFNFQLIIIEVKCNPRLSFSGMQDDLLKIQQFINSYKYKKGVFLTVNTDPDKMAQIFATSETLIWLKKNINTPENILFMCKKGQNEVLFEKSILEIVESKE